MVCAPVLGFLVECSDIGEEVDELHSSKYDRGLLSEEVERVRDVGELCSESGYASSTPSTRSWYRVTSRCDWRYSSFSGAAFSLGVHLGGGVKFGIYVGFGRCWSLRCTFANDRVLSCVCVWHEVGT